MITHILNQDSDFHKKFVGFLQKRNKRSDTKNVQLYKLILKGNESSLQKQLGVNAFNVLKKRLLDAYIEFLIEHETSIIHSKEIDNYKLMLLGKYLMKNGYRKEGSKILFCDSRYEEPIKYDCQLLTKGVFQYTTIMPVYPNVLGYEVWKDDFSTIKIMNIRVYKEPQPKA